jgi:hypothetical protein
MNGWTAAAWALALLGRWVPAVGLAVGSSIALTRKLPDVPRAEALRLAAHGQLFAGQQIATAARRAWWPILVVGAVVSRRCRWWLALAVLSDVRAASTDAAYGWGVWTGMLRTRTWTPIVPRLSAWPPRSTQPSGSTLRST